MWNLGTLGQFFGRQRPSVDEELENKSLIGPPILAGPPKPQLLTTGEVMAAYGNPGDPDNLTAITVPYPFRLAWPPGNYVRKVTIHKKVAAPFLAVLNDLQAHYGVEKIKELGIDLFGGCYNFRPQRGTEAKYQAAVKAGNNKLAVTYLSRHSWAIAVDLDPARNQLKWKSNKAQFAKPEYKAMNDIFYKHGFIGYGRERNNDWMHFEIGVLG